MDNFLSYLTKNKTVLLILILILAGVFFLFGWMVGYYPMKGKYTETRGWGLAFEQRYNTLATENKNLRTEYESAKTELEKLKEKSEQEMVKVEPFYRYHAAFSTYDIAVIGVNMGKGDRFAARMLIWKTDIIDKRRRAVPPVEGRLVFWVNNPKYNKIVDSGRLLGEHTFEFTAEESGEYQLVFQDVDEKCVVEMFYDSPAKIWDVSVPP